MISNSAACFPILPSTRLSLLQMKRNARLMRGMSPDRRIDALELMLTHLNELREANFFNSLVKKNRDARKALTRLEVARAACVKKASVAYGLNPASLDRLADALIKRLTEVAAAPSADDDLLDIIKLSIQLPLLEGIEALSFSRLFLVDCNTLDQAGAEIKSSRSRLASLTVRHLPMLKGIGYTSTSLAYLTRTSWAGHVEALVVREKRALESSIEELIQERDHSLAELTRQSLSERQRGALTSRVKGVGPKVTRLLSLWTWWHRFDPGKGDAAAGWKAEAEASIKLLVGDKRSSKGKGKASRAAGGPGAAASGDGPSEALGLLQPASSSSFPWDADEVQGAAAAARGSPGGDAARAPLPPRSFLVEYIDVRAELERSKEEETIFGPMALRRSVEHFDRYLAGIEAARGRIGEEVVNVVAAIRPAAPIAAGPPPAAAAAAAAGVRAAAVPGAATGAGQGQRAAMQEAALLAADCLFRQVMLGRREAVIRLRVAQGEYARQNWNAKGEGIDIGGRARARTASAGAGADAAAGPRSSVGVAAAPSAPAAAPRPDDAGSESDLSDEELEPSILQAEGRAAMLAAAEFESDGDQEQLDAADADEAEY